MNALSRPFVQNPYYQAFCGEKSFQWQLPCDPTDFVYFRKRIGEDGTRLIFEALSANTWQRGPRRKTIPPLERRIARERFHRRAGIEPTAGAIGHLKQDHRMARNYLKGVLGDAINLFMAAAAFNFKKWMRKLVHFFALFTLWLFCDSKSHQSASGAL